MAKGIRSAFFLSLAISVARGNPAIWTPKILQPVQGLYVKPSIDGTTGDLYVAATEENGVDAQWLTDQPVNFLPQAAASQTHQTALPLYQPFTANLPQAEVSTNQKRSIISNPALNYAYALPLGAPAEANAAPCPYAATQAANLPAEASVTPALSLNTDASPQLITPTQVAPAGYPYSAFQYFYPQLMSAYANAALKEAGLSEESAGTNTSQATPVSWPHAPYAFPVQYVMMNPNAWIQGQANTQPTVTAATNSIQTEENES